MFVVHYLYCIMSLVPMADINPLVTNGLSHPYHLNKSTLILKGIRSNLSFLFPFFDEIHVSKQNRSDGTPRFVASHLGLFCLPMSHKKDDRLIWVN